MAILLVARVEHQRVAVLFGIVGHDRAHLPRHAVDQSLHVVLEVALRVLRIAVQLLFLFVDGAGRVTRSLIGQLRVVRLQLLRQAVDLVAQALELLAPGIVLLLQIGKVALELVGLGDRGLKGDDRDLGGSSGRSQRPLRGGC